MSTFWLVVIALTVGGALVYWRGNVKQFVVTKINTYRAKP